MGAVRSIRCENDDYQAVFVQGIAHSSYLVGGADTCAVIDPARDEFNK